eukprot:4796794-Prymnesium_polylepis.1
MQRDDIQGRTVERRTWRGPIIFILGPDAGVAAAERAGSFFLGHWAHGRRGKRESIWVCLAAQQGEARLASHAKACLAGRLPLEAKAFLFVGSLQLRGRSASAPTVNMHAHTKRNELGVQVPTATRVRQVSLGRAGWRCSWGHYQIVVAEVETNALSPSEPAGQG